jgi:hypothetical protein
VSEGTLSVLAQHLALAMRPLTLAMADAQTFRLLFQRIGWSPEDIPAAYLALGDAAVRAVEAAQALGDDPSPAQVLTLLQNAKSIFEAASNMGVAPNGGILIDPAALGRGLFDALVIDYLAVTAPKTAMLLEMCGIIRREFVPRGPSEQPFVRSHLDLEEISRIVQDPSRLARTVYGWGTDTFDFPRFAEHLTDLAIAAGLPTSVQRVRNRFQEGTSGAPGAVGRGSQLRVMLPFAYVDVGDDVAEVGLQVLSLPAEDTHLPGLIIGPAFPEDITLVVNLSSASRLRFRGEIDTRTTLGIVLRPGEVSARFPFAPGTPRTQAAFGIQFEYSPPTPRVLLGDRGATRLELEGVRAELGTQFDGTDLEISIECTFQNCRLVLAASDGDGFLTRLVGGSNVSVPVPLGLRWSNRAPLAFTGTSSFSVTATPRVSVGPVRFDTLTLVVAASPAAPGTPAATALEVGATIGCEFGPVGMTVSGVGVELRTRFAPGNAGPFDIAVGFKAPTGIGIRVNAGPVAGGGFIAFDAERGRYSGLLQLDILGVSVTAIAVLDTRLPGGTPAYSFLLLITAQFPPIQVGFGFTLNGLGGLAGLHRTIAADPLRIALRDGSVGGILFPPDPVRNGPRLIGELTRFLPAAADRYVFGPVAKLGYGTPTLLEVDLGIILELPAPLRIVLLGVLRARFPNRDAPVVRINLDALGVLDLGERTFSLDASLYDSRVAGFDLAGDMALRLSWGDQPTFALAVGGFNPHFTPPPAFPALRRLSLALGSGANPRLALEAYFALTSNTLQFGARATLYAAVAGFSIDGALAFDALIVFDPFCFRVDIAASLALTGFGMRLASIRVEGLLEGPRPWHIAGSAHVSVLFLEVEVAIDARFGEAERQPSPASVSAWELLRPALEEPRSWAGTLAPAALRAVTVTGAAIPPGAAGSAGGAGSEPPPLLDPGGGLEVRQRILPLGRRILKVGEQRLTEGPATLTVTAVRVDGTAVPTDALAPLTEPFAAGQYEDLGEAERLSRPSFEPMQAGVAVAASAVRCGTARSHRVHYETVLVGGDTASPVRRPGYQPTPAAVAGELRSAAALGPRRDGLARYAPPPATAPRVALGDEQWVIASTTDLRPTGLAPAGPHGATAQALDAYLTAHPATRGTLQIIPAQEAAPAEAIA